MKQRIKLSLVFIAFLGIAMTSIVVTFAYYSLFQNQVKNDIKQVAAILSESDIYTMDNTVNKIKNSTPEPVGEFRITIVSDDGNVTYDNMYDASLLENHGDRSEIKDALCSGEGESIRHSKTMNMDTFYYAVLLDNGTVLRVSTNVSTAAKVFYSALPVIIIIMILVFLICVIVSNFLTRKLIEPLELLSKDFDDDSVTVYKEIEPLIKEMRLQHEKVLDAALSRQDFTANVSHELKTPITAISGYAEIIENHLVNVEEEAHIAKQIRHNADRLLLLVNDIIQLSELDHFEITGNFERINLFKIAEKCVDELQGFAKNRNIDLVCSGRDTYIHGDNFLIRELTDNLVNNAIQYNKEGGKVEATAVKEGRYSVLIVKDTGIGIPADETQRVFERFYRVDKSRSKETGGTGLGLAIVKHIADIHNAKISINSKLYSGTEIRISFNTFCNDSDHLKAGTDFKSTP